MLLFFCDVYEVVVAVVVVVFGKVDDDAVVAKQGPEVAGLSDFYQFVKSQKDPLLSRTVATDAIKSNSERRPRF